MSEFARFHEKSTPSRGVYLNSTRCKTTLSPDFSYTYG
jgi:hypothetical protein